jgi:multiple antibiotic resistance protein
MQIWKAFFIAFSTLLPMIAPMGASLQIFTLVGLVPDPTYRILARRIAINNIILLSIVEVLGSAILTFFGISIPIIEIAGGGVIAAIGWKILHQSDEVPSTGAKNAVARGSEERNMITLSQQMFYPFTFPILSGPGAIVAMLTLSARASRPSLSANLIGPLCGCCDRERNVLFLLRICTETCTTCRSFNGSSVAEAHFVHYLGHRYSIHIEWGECATN